MPPPRDLDANLEQIPDEVPPLQMNEFMPKHLPERLVPFVDALLLYDKSAGQALPGLTRRRQWERRLILTGDYSLDNI